MSARRPAPAVDTIASLDAEIAALKASRATATCLGQLDMINDAIDAARAARRALVRTR